MGHEVAVVSYRFGGNDGVSVEARKWASSLETLGFAVRRVAGEIEDDGRPGDIVLPPLAIDAEDAPNRPAIDRALAGADLVIVENLCSLPLNVAASRAVGEALASTRARVLLRHHDLPWQRRHLASLETEFPPRLDDAMHVAVNLRSRRELQARGFDHAYTIHNYFDLDPPPGARDATRKSFGFDDDEFVVFQPARAIERKNVPGGMRFAQQLAQMMPGRRIHFWLSGPAEDGYAGTLDKLLARATTPVTVGRADSADDAYAASDVIVFPSTWEGFGNPTIESIAARRPLTAFPYPVLAEILASGIRPFSTAAPENVVRFLSESDAVREQYHDVNLRRARLSFDLAQLPGAIDEAFAQHGWRTW